MTNQDSSVNLLRPPGADAPARRHLLIRAGVAILGLLSVGVGILLLTNMVSAVRSLVWLASLGLVLSGLLEITAPQHRRKWLDALMGALLIAGGLLALAWPSATLWTLALIVGVNLLVHGLLLVGASVVERRAWLVVAGVVNVAVGLLALSWPAATVLVMALLLGVQIVIFGVVAIIAAFVMGRPQSGADATVAATLGG